MSSCATAVKAVPVIGIVAKPGTNKPVGIKSEPAVVKAVQQVIGVESIKPGTNKPVGVKPVEPAVVESKLGSEPKTAGFTSIFVRVSKTVTVDQLQGIFGVEANIGRRNKNRKFVKVFIPDDDVGRILKLDILVSGHKLRVEKWRSSKGPVHRAPAVASTSRNGHQATKEQARFVMEFLDAQAARPGDRRLYSQVASNNSEARMKSMETAIYDVRQLMKCLSKR